jgi:hypothetical protein
MIHYIYLEMHAINFTIFYRRHFFVNYPYKFEIKIENRYNTPLFKIAWYWLPASYTWSSAACV